MFICIKTHCDNPRIKITESGPRARGADPSLRPTQFINFAFLSIFPTCFQETTHWNPLNPLTFSFLALIRNLLKFLARFSAYFSIYIITILLCTCSRAFSYPVAGARLFSHLHFAVWITICSPIWTERILNLLQTFNSPKFVGVSRCFVDLDTESGSATNETGSCFRCQHFIPSTVLQIWETCQWYLSFLPK